MGKTGADLFKKQTSPLFKCEETVRMKAQKNVRVFIIEVLQQTCPGGSQVWYKGRPFSVNGVYGGNVAKEPVQFQEVELEEIPKPSKDKGKFLAELEALNDKKSAFIKNQDFEKASALRDQIRILEEKIRAIEEDEGTYCR